MSLNRLLLYLFCCLAFGFSACKKDIPPRLEFKQGENYSSSDIRVAPGSTIIVGSIAEKTSSDLKLFYVEYAYEGANTAFLADRWALTTGEQRRYEKDYTITVRNQPGRERWIFNINDSEGRLTKKEINIIVQ